MPKDKNKKSKKEQFIENCDGKHQEMEKENKHNSIDQNKKAQPQQEPNKQNLATDMSNMDNSIQDYSNLKIDAKLEQKQNEDIMSEKLTSILKLG